MDTSKSPSAYRKDHPSVAVCAITPIASAAEADDVAWEKLMFDTDARPSVPMVDEVELVRDGRGMTCVCACVCGEG